MGCRSSKQKDKQKHEETKKVKKRKEKTNPRNAGSSQSLNNVEHTVDHAMSSSPDLNHIAPPEETWSLSSQHRSSKDITEQPRSVVKQLINLPPDPIQPMANHLDMQHQTPYYTRETLDQRQDAPNGASTLHVGDSAVFAPLERPSNSLSAASKPHTVFRSTIRDTGRGLAKTPDFVPRRPGEVPSTYEDVKSTCLNSGTLWEDPEFPPIASSIYYKNPPSDWPNIQWMRPSEICSNPQLFINGASRMDVIQGKLGDCWLLAAVASLTINQKLLHKVVPPDQSFDKEYAGVFRFQFWQYGRWEEVLIDDRLPTQNNKLIYMRSKDQNEFWSALLEKAYAKLNGSYEALIGGWTSEALTDFTGGVVERYKFKSNTPPDLYQIMKKAHNKGSLMGCSIDSSGENMDPCLSNGLIVGHAYSITDVRPIQVQTSRVSGKIPMVRVRNPWGNSSEWKGAWSDKSQEWQAISSAEKLDMGLTFEHDGEFWMSFKDFLSNYDLLEICFLGPDSLTEVDEQKGTRKWEGCLFEGAWHRRVNAGGCSNYKATFWTNPQYRVKIVDPDSDDEDGHGSIIIGLMQKERRKLKKEGKEDLCIGYDVYKAPPSQTGTLDKSFFDRRADFESKFTSWREVSSHHKLLPGDYIIVPSTSKPDEEGDFLLRIFSERKNDKAEEIDDVTTTVDIKKDALGDKDPADKAKKEEGRHAFLYFAGADEEIDAFYLQNILNVTFKKDFAFDGFSTDLTGSMVAMRDPNLTGKLGFEDFKRLWADLTLCKRAFKMMDTDGNGFFNSYEFRNVLNNLGFRVSNALFTMIVMKYSDTEGHVRFDNLVSCYFKLMIVFGLQLHLDTFRRIYIHFAGWEHGIVYASPQAQLLCSAMPRSP